MSPIRRLLRAALFVFALNAPVAALAQSEAEVAQWNRAVTLMQAGDVAAALPLLERLVSEAPGKAVYRLELAAALFRQGRYGRARYHADLAALGDLAPEARRAARRIASTAADRQPLTGYFQLNILPETNPGRQTSQSSVDINGIEFGLNEDARAEASTSVIVVAGGTYMHPLGDRLRLRFGADLWARHNPDERLQDRQLTLRAGPFWQGADGSRFGIDVTRGRNWNAGVPVDETRGLRLEAGRPLGQRSYLAFAAARTWASATDGTGDEVDDRLVLGLSHMQSDTLLLRGNLSVLRKEARFATQDYTERGLSVGAQKFWSGGWTVQGDLSVARRSYGGRDPLFGIARQDDRLRLDLSVMDRDLRIGPFVPELRLGLERARSSIDMRSYDNRALQISFTRRF